MGIPLYLAMTAAELTATASLPERIGWMACHFSAYGSGLSNLPPSLPPDSLLIVNDRTPIFGHDPLLICETLVQILERDGCNGVLLDFQRPEEAQTQALVNILTQQLPCPTAVSEAYAKKGSSPVFLPPPALHQPLQEYLAPWEGREIWLEAATACEQYTVTVQGCGITREFPVSADTLPFQCAQLHCRYRLDLHEDAACFILQRGKEELRELLQEAETLGVTNAIGLFQELG